MFNILLSKMLSWGALKEFIYLLIAVGYYVAVRVQGEKHFTTRDKKLSKKEVIKLMKN